MIRVKIVNGAAIDVEVLQKCKIINISEWSRVASFWCKYVLDRFQIICIDSNELTFIEGHEYWACPCGNGRIWLKEHIGENALIA